MTMSVARAFTALINNYFVRQTSPLIRSKVTALYVVADAEDISKDRSMKENGRQNDSEDMNTFLDSWIPTASGGFLPNFRRRSKTIANSFTRHKIIPKQGIEGYTKNTKTFDRYSDEPKQAADTLQRVHEVLSIQDYKRVVVDEKKSIVVVRFYAAWCRACKAISFRFRHQLPAKFPDVKFVEVPLTKDNAFLHQGLGVPSLPYAHIYHPEAGLVEERKINQRVFSDFVEVLQTYRQGYCEIVENKDERQESL